MDVAENFDLSESMLSILALAGVPDRRRIEDLWADLIQKGLYLYFFDVSIY